MRDYYDGERPSVAVERTVAASARDIWGLITDLELPARFSTEYQGGEWLDNAAGPVVGARFIGHNHNDVMDHWDTICHVIECDPPNRYAWAVDDVDEPNATWRFMLTPDGTHTVVRFETVLGPGRSGLTKAINEHPHRRDALIAWRLEDLRRNMQAVVDGISEIAETRHTRQR